MKILTTAIIIFMYMFVFSIQAQELNNKKNKGDVITKPGKIESVTAAGDKVTIKDGTTTLIEVTNEGSAGSITLPDVGSTVISGYKLYNSGGSLYWFGSKLGTAGSAGGWTDDGPVVRLTTAADKVGIGVTSPSAALHVTGNDGVLFEGVFGSGTIPKEGAGTRMMWYPKKAAFRVGRASTTEWDDTNIGDYSTAMGDASIASGYFSTAMGYQSNASGNTSTAMGASSASGDYSTAMGNLSNATGNFSTAMGSYTDASGQYSTAMGDFSIASGTTSTAMGDNSTASGVSSTAMGHYTKAQSFVSTAIGRFNIGGGTSDLWVVTDPLFEIGNGQDDTHRANAVTVLKNSNVGIGTAFPSATLHVTGNDGVLFEGTFGSGTIPKEGAGTRMMWYPKKAAFRAGSANTTEWDDANIGNYSTAMGYTTSASGDYSTAMGYISTASGESSTAMGYISTASGYASTAMGESSTASGDYSTAMGYISTASGLSSTAMGYSTASGSYSTAMGHYTKAQSFVSTAIGRFNIGHGTATSWLDTDPLFEIGNGQDDTYRNNAVTVLKNGNVGIGTPTPSEYLHVDGGNILVKGTNGFQAANDEAIVKLGDNFNYIKGIWGYGIKLGVYGVTGAALSILSGSGNVGIGTESPTGKLDVNGSIYQRGGSLHADYVFEDDYELESIEEHADFMWKNKHLKAIPKAATDENGAEIVEVGAHRKGIVEELEKAHIYISRLEKAIKKLNNRLDKLEMK